MFRNDLFRYGSYLGFSFETLFAHIAEAERKQKNEQAGIVFDSELDRFGVPEKNIPFNYIQLDFTGKHYVAVMDDNVSRLVVRRGFRNTKLSIMIRRLLEFLHLIKPQKPRLQQTDVSGSASRKPNPYQLVWYKQGWSENRVRKNNSKYWEFEIEHNGLRLP